MSNRSRIIAAAVVASVLVALCAAGLHGFSITRWHQVIDGGPEDEILAGASQPIRSDDWLVFLPFALSQATHRPPFPVVNTTIGNGQNMLLIYNAPVAHPLILFRPFTWGYFVGQDFGLAWYWWARIFALGGLLYQVCLLLSRGQRAVSAFTSLAVVLSPFMQFWSYVYAESVVGMLGTVLAVHALATATTRRGIALAGLLLGWAAGTFALTLYPSFLISLSYAAFGLLAACLLVNREAVRSRLKTFRRDRVVALIAGGVLSFGALAWLIVALGPALETMMNTAYPGRRALTGGDYTLATLFSNVVLVFRLDYLTRMFPNICEGASFLYVFPLVLLIVLWQRFGQRKPVSPAVWPLMGVAVLFVVWMLAGFPAWLATATQLEKVQPSRTVLALGLVNAALVAALAGSELKFSRRAQIGLAVVWLLLVARPIRLLYKFGLVDLDRSLLVVVLFLGVFAFLLTARAALAMALVAAVSGYATIRFNPLVRGGWHFISENPVSSKVTEVAKRGPERWAVFGDELINLPRMLGVASINGTHFYPQIDLWRPIDPDMGLDRIYNRFAHVFFRPVTGDTKLEVPVEDTIWVAIDPASPAFTAWNVRYYLVSGPTDAFTSRPELFTPVATVGKHAIFERRP